MQLPLARIRIDGGTQSRAELSQETWQDYARAMKEGVDFPAMILFHDGSDYWLADGFHRYFAYRENKVKTVAVIVRTGTRRDAILYAVSANLQGQQRATRKDREHAVRLLLADEEWRMWSAREIGRRCGVAPSTVSAYKTKVAEEAKPRVAPSKATSGGGGIPSLSNLDSDRVTYQNKHGTVTEMSVAGIAAAAERRAEGSPAPKNEPLGPEEDVDELDADLEEVDEADEDDAPKLERQLKKTVKKLWRWADKLGVDAQSLVCQSTKLKRFCRKLGKAPSEELKRLRPKPL